MSEFGRRSTLEARLRAEAGRTKCPRRRPASHIDLVGPLCCVVRPATSPPKSSACQFGRCRNLDAGPPWRHGYGPKRVEPSAPAVGLHRILTWWALCAAWFGPQPRLRSRPRVNLADVGIWTPVHLGGTVTGRSG